MNGVTTSIDYDVRRGEDGGVELVINLHPTEAAHLRDRLDAVLNHGVV